MDYPLLDVPLLGGSLLIATVAIVHVVIAHFAVGAGIFNAFQERAAIAREDAVMLRFLRRSSRFLILFAFALGALTGVGIWWTIALVAPRATSNLIHLFVWAWAAEWTLFVVELAAGYIYYYGWDRLSPRRHNIVGWIYAAASWGSLVIINGIISFMLTPGRFLGPEDFWSNLLNPSFWPSTLVRTISSLSLAAIFAMILVNYSRGFTREQRHHVIRAAAKWLTPLILMPALAWWYFRVAPEAARIFIFRLSSVAMWMLFGFGIVMSLFIAAYAFFGLLLARHYINGETALLLLGMAFLATGAMEFVREGIRKPYLIRPAEAAGATLDAAPDRQGLYSTQLTPAELHRAERDGTLTLARWYRRTGDPVADGRSIFQVQCAACHTVNGAYNPVASLVRNWNDAKYQTDLANLHITSEAMPHYRPAQRDRADLEAYLRTLNPPPD